MSLPVTSPLHEYEVFYVDATAAISEEDLGDSGSTTGSITVGAGFRRVITGYTAHGYGSASSATVLFRNANGGDVILALRMTNNGHISDSGMYRPGEAGDEITIDVPNPTSGGYRITLETRVEPV